jgi:hypothetical protein
MGDPYPGKIKYLGDTKVQLTYEEVVASLGLGGWPQDLWAKGAAVITAESNRTANIYNTYLQGHFGLMQIGQQQHPEFFQSLGNPGDWMDPRANCREGYSIYRSQGWGAWESATNGKYAPFIIQATAAVNAVKSHIAKDQLAPKAIPSMGPHGQQAVLQSYLAQKGDGIIVSLQAIELGQAGQSVVKALAAAGEKTGQVTVAGGAAAADVAAAMQSNSIFGAVQMLIGAGAWIANPSNWIRVAQVFAGGALLVAGISIVAKPVLGTATSVLPAGKLAGMVKKAAA